MPLSQVEICLIQRQMRERVETSQLVYKYCKERMPFLRNQIPNENDFVNGFFCSHKCPCYVCQKNKEELTEKYNADSSVIEKKKNDLEETIKQANEFWTSHPELDEVINDGEYRKSQIRMKREFMDNGFGMHRYSRALKKKRKEIIEFWGANPDLDEEFNAGKYRKSQEEIKQWDEFEKEMEKKGLLSLYNQKEGGTYWNYAKEEAKKLLSQPLTVEETENYAKALEKKKELENSTVR